MQHLQKKMAKKLLVGDVRFANMFMREVSCQKIMPVRYAVMEQMILSQYMKANCINCYPQAAKTQSRRSCAP